MKPLKLAALPLLLLAACSATTSSDNTIERYRPIAIGGVEVAAIRYIGENDTKAKAALLAAESVELLLSDGEPVLVADLSQILFNVFLPNGRLAPEEEVLVRTTLQLVTEDLAAFAGAEGVVTPEVAGRVMLYTAAVKRQAQRVLGDEPEIIVGPVTPL